jgi:TolB-like protein
MKTKNIYFLMMVSIFMLLNLVWADDGRTLAVLYFDNNSLTKKSDMDPLTKGLADMLITELGKISQCKVVERNQLQQILEEMKLAQSGLVTGKTAQEVGKMLGAQNLLFGSYMLMLDNKLRIDVRIVQVETGVTVRAEEVTGNPKDLYKLVATLVVKIAKDLDVQLSKADALKLATIDNTSFDATLYYAKGLEYEDARDYKNATRMYENALKKNAQFRKAQERLAVVKKK